MPSPRSGHSAVALPDGRHLLLFGGGDLKRDLFHSGCALLDTHTWRWRSPRIQVGSLERQHLCLLDKQTMSAAKGPPLQAPASPARHTLAPCSWHGDFI